MEDPSALGQSFWTSLWWAMTVSTVQPASAHCTSEVAWSPGALELPAVSMRTNVAAEPPEVTFYCPWPHIQSPPIGKSWHSSLKWILNLPLLHVLWPPCWSRSQPSLDPRRRAPPNWTGTRLVLSLLGAPKLHHLMGLSQTFSPI